MSTQNEKQAAEQLLYGYAEVLNTANTALIASFYTHDGIFIPNGFRTLSKMDLEASDQKYLKRNRFKISYDIQNVMIAQDFAFIDATAQTTVSSNEDKETFQLSRDFFVLRKQGTDWKIFRYLFNKVQD